MIGTIVLSLCLEEVRLQARRTTVVEAFQHHGAEALLVMAVNAAVTARLASQGDVTRDEMAASLDAHGVTAVAARHHPPLSGMIDPETGQRKPTRSVDDPVAALVDIANHNLDFERGRKAESRARIDAMERPAWLRPAAPATAGRREYQVPGRGQPFRDPDGHPTIVSITDRDAVRWDGSPRSDPWM